MENPGVLSVYISTVIAFCSGYLTSWNCGKANCSYDNTKWTFMSTMCRGNKLIVSFQCIQMPLRTFNMTCVHQSQSWEGTSPCSSPLTSLSPSTSSVTAKSTQLKTTKTVPSTTKLPSSTSSPSPGITPSQETSKRTTKYPNQSRLCNTYPLLSKLASLNVVPFDSDVSTPKRQEFSVGGKLRFKCSKDYRFINGTLDQVCSSDGEWHWVGEMPYCKRCKCPCKRMKKQVIIKTQKELQDKITAIQKKLVVEKKNLASQKNTKISAADPRPSAKAVGSILGVGIITFVFAIIVLSDLPILYRHIRFGPHKKIRGSALPRSKSKDKKITENVSIAMEKIN